MAPVTAEPFRLEPFWSFLVLDRPCVDAFSTNRIINVNMKLTVCMCEGEGERERERERKERRERGRERGEREKDHISPLQPYTAYQSLVW